MSLQQKIDDIELELSRTQVNKSTMHHICLLRAKLVKYQKQLKPRKYESQITGEELKQLKYGHSRIGIFGMKESGKTSLFDVLKEEEMTETNEIPNFSFKIGIFEQNEIKI